ncbi:unnamed protein product [Lathyrus sativus]|nr:unnamed protein product [Lathyrus sativus]
MKVEMEVDVDDGSGVDMSSEIDELCKRFWSLDVVGKRELKGRVCEHAYPITTSMYPPPEKLKNKGAMNKGKKPVGYDVYRDPSSHEYVNQASQTLKRQSQPSQTLKKHSQSKKQLMLHQFSLQFPNHIRSYIKYVVNVASDGNC